MAYRFVVDMALQPGARDRVLAESVEAQAATRAEAGCIAYDIFTCTDDPDRLVFVESWADRDAHAFHMEQEHTKRFIAFHEPLLREMGFHELPEDA